MTPQKHRRAIGWKFLPIDMRASSPRSPQHPGMQHEHPTVLPLPQRQQLAAAVRRHGVAPIAKTLGLGREQTARLAGGIDVRPGTLALCQAALPRLDAALDASNPGPPQAALPRQKDEARSPSAPTAK